MTPRTHTRVPASWPVRPVKPDAKKHKGKQGITSCGHCGLHWDDHAVTGMTPSPAGRCPFEAFHCYPATEETPHNG